MTPEQKRIRIAELDGWKNKKCNCGCDRDWTPPDGGVAVYKHQITDYLNNRDAIVEAIKRRFVTREQSREFGEAILRLVEPGCCDTRDIAFVVAIATAEQLSDAYLQDAQ